MRAFNLSVAGVVASVFLFGSVGSVSAIEPFDLSSVSLQYQREVRSTYIIQFRDSVAPSEVQGRANAIAARFQGRLRHTYTHALNGFAVRMNAGAMANLLEAEDLGIVSISRAVIMTVAQASDNAAPQARGGNPGKPGGGGGGGGCDQSIGWNILRVTTLNEGNTNCSDAAGAGTVGYDDYFNAGTATNYPSVCVLDTGVSAHEDLNIGFQFSVSTPSTNVEDVYGHGTHVAGIIGAVANSKGVVGVAPGLVINSIKVLSDDGYGSDFDVIAGIDMALDRSCDIVNMSLGGSGSIPLDDAVKNASAGGTPPGTCNVFEKDSEGNDIESQPLCLTKVTADSNIIFTLAAGNSAADISGYSPARASTGSDDNIFTIASFGQERKTNDDLWSSFSNYGQTGSLSGLVDFVLPGGKIRSTVPGGYATYNGTSMSAPHMAGLLVRYISDGGSTSCTDGSSRICIGNGAFTSVPVDEIERISKIGRLVISSGEFYEIATDK